MKSVKKIIASMLLGVMVIGAGVQLPVSAMGGEQRASQVQPNSRFKPVDKLKIISNNDEYFLKKLGKVKLDFADILLLRKKVCIDDDINNGSAEVILGRAKTTIEETKQRPTFAGIKLAAQLYSQASEAFVREGNISKANECYAEAKQATAFNEYIVWKAGFSNQEQCLEDMGKAAQFFKKAYRDYRNDGNNLKAHECYAKSLAAYAFVERANADLSVLEGKSAFENLEKAAKLFEKAAKALENIGDEKLATCFSQRSKEAYNKIIGKSLDRMS